MRALVLGSGLAGITAAYYLRKNGLDVTVVDRAAGPARETSYANGSMITPSLADPWNSPGVFGVLLRSLGREDSAMLLRPSALPSLIGWGIAFLRNSSQRNFERNYLSNVGLVHYSQWVMRDLLQAHAFAFDHAYDGTVKIFRNSAAYDYGVKVAHFLKQAGVQHRSLDRAALLEVEPQLHAVIDEICGGIAFPGDETGNARLFCEELRRICAADGVAFRYAENVVDIATDRKRVAGLRTAKETLAADVYVLAAGSFSATWAKHLRFELPVRQAIRSACRCIVGNNAPGCRSSTIRCTRRSSRSAAYCASPVRRSSPATTPRCVPTGSRTCAICCAACIRNSPNRPRAST